MGENRGNSPKLHLLMSIETPKANRRFESPASTEESLLTSGSVAARTLCGAGVVGPRPRETSLRSNLGQRACAFHGPCEHHFMTAFYSADDGIVQPA